MCLMCQGLTRAEVTAIMRSQILEHGFSITTVEAGGRREPPFAYTVGLSRTDHPELICFNVHPDCAVRSLTPIARAVLDEGFVLDEGSDVDAVLGGTGARLLRFPDSSTHLFDANRFYRKAGGPPVRALQLVWPRCEPLPYNRAGLD
jgi:hypothetical protein